MFAAVLLLSLVATSLAVHPGFKTNGNLEWKNCGNRTDDWITVKKFDITPSPIRVPGRLRVNLDTNVTHDLWYNLAMDVVFEKELLGVYTKVVCVMGVGTCLYEDPCLFLNAFNGPQGCLMELTKNGIPCRCPFRGYEFKLPKIDFIVTSISNAWSFLTTGTYHIKLTMIEKATSKIRGCFETYLKIQY